MKWLASLTTLSALVLALGLLIALISGFNAVSGGKSNKERALAALITVLASGLLVAQFISSRQTSAASKIESAAAQKKILEATLGSDMCPSLSMNITAGQRPSGMSVMNSDKEANIYDLVVYIREGVFTPVGNHLPNIPLKTLRFPTVPEGAGIPSIPYDLSSQGDDAYLQYELATRRKICSGMIAFRKNSSGNWIQHLYPVHNGPLSFHAEEVSEAKRRLEQGLDW